MLLFWPPNKKPATFTFNTPQYSGSSDLLNKGFDFINQNKGTLNKYGINTSTLTVPMGGFAGANQIGGRSSATITRSNPSSISLGSGSGRIRTSSSSSGKRPRGTYFGDPVTQQKQFNLDTYAKAAPGVLFGQGDPGFETPAMRVARQNRGDLSGPGGPLPILGQGNPRFGETGVGNVFAEGDPRLTQSSPSTRSLSMMGEYPMPSGLNY